MVEILVSSSPSYPVSKKKYTTTRYLIVGTETRRDMGQVEPFAVPTNRHVSDGHTGLKGIVYLQTPKRPRLSNCHAFCPGQHRLQEI